MIAKHTVRIYRISKKMLTGYTLMLNYELYKLLQFSMFSGMSKEAFNKLLSLLHDFILPIGNLPTVKPRNWLILTVTEYHCCINDCIIYRDCRDSKYNSLRKCPVWTTIWRKWKDSKKGIYLSVATRIARLFSDPVTSQLVPNHSNSLHVDCIELSTFISSLERVHGDRRAISFAICAESLCPFAHERSTHSMWSIFLIPLNLPHKFWVHDANWNCTWT